jgi:hypothetical protein
MVSNCFGDRWTYLEITGPLFVLVAAAVRANQLAAQEPLFEPNPVNSNAPAAANAKQNTPHTAWMAHDRALAKVMQRLLKDETGLQAVRGERGV